MRKTIVTAIMVLLVIVGNAFATEPVLTVPNGYIAEKALGYKIGDDGGSCKRFVQNVLGEAGITLGEGYQSAYTKIGLEISDEEATYGDIIQVSDDANPADTSHVHSAIVLERLGRDHFKVIHSNWHWDETVDINEFHPQAWSQGNPKNEGYPQYPDYSAHFYRLGTIVGLYSDGYHATNIYDMPSSKVFIDAYQEAGGYASLGSPWKNPAHPGSEFVHCWPNECSDANALWVQDFLKDGNKWSQLVYKQGKAYAVKDKILQYWWSHWGYNDFGPPTGFTSYYQAVPVTDKWQGSSYWIIQTFGISNKPTYIAYSPSTGVYLTHNEVANPPKNIQRLVIANQAVSDDLGGGIGGGFDELGNPIIPAFSLPCAQPSQIPPGGINQYWSGLIMNGRLDLCGAHGWQGVTVDLGHACDQGDNTRGTNNCVVNLNVNFLKQGMNN